jgi:hypothetical protein
MSKTYVIHWTSKNNGRMGTGTTRFEKEEAMQLAEELNADFPDIHHEVVNVGEENQVVPAMEAGVGEPVSAA